MYHYYRFFKTKEYAEQFLRGEIYMNYLGYFWENGGLGQKDLYEGAARIVPPDEFPGLSKDFKEALLSGITEIPIATSFVNVISFTKLFVDDNIGFYIPFDECIREFGAYAVRITDINEFTRRIFRVFSEKNDIGIAGNVGYFSLVEQKSCALDLFYKDISYMNQNEWRILCIHDEESIKAKLRKKQTTEGEGEAYTPKIGDISDISILYETERLFRELPLIYGKYQPWTRKQLERAPFSDQYAWQYTKEAYNFASNTRISTPYAFNQKINELSGYCKSLFCIG